MICVGMAEAKIARSPEILQAVAVGSCVVITVYDSSNMIGGMAHCILPDNKCGGATSNPLKFVDAAIDYLLRQMNQYGVLKNGLEAKLVGGADMFSNAHQNDGSLGSQNVAAARSKLKKEGLPIVAENVGGISGRSAELDTLTGTVTIKLKI